jgi:hypothetical protein
MVELLIVVSVIIILAGLLLPALQRTKKQVRATGCMNSLRQTGMIALMYCRDQCVPSNVNLAQLAPPVQRTGQSPFLFLACVPPLPPPLPGPAPSAGSNAVSFVVAQCPYADPNPASDLDPANELPYRSYGTLQYNLGKRVEEAWTWLFADSVFRQITDRSELAASRHDQTVNCFFEDGRFERLRPENVPFPP